MKLYCSFIVQDNENSKPWLCTITDSCLTLEEAKKVIEKGRRNYRLISAWIDRFDENGNKTIVLHECYI